MFWKKKSKKVPVPEIGMPLDSAPIDLDIVIRTDLGNERTNNEDAALFLRVAEENIIRKKGYLLLVADGMGGHNAGEIASRMAVEVISQEYFKPGSGGNPEKILKRAFAVANQQIFQAGTQNRENRGMGTTCTAIVIHDNELFFAHAGDSRAYVLHGSSLLRITEDHTYVQMLVNQGAITATEAATHPERNVLTNAMGTKPDIRVDAGKCPVNFENEDRVLICSDGLYDYFSDEELQERLQHGSLADIADELIATAKERGGKDNITLALAQKKGKGKLVALKSTRDADLPVN